MNDIHCKSELPLPHELYSCLDKPNLMYRLYQGGRFPSVKPGNEASTNLLFSGMVVNLSDFFMLHFLGSD